MTNKVVANGKCGGNVFWKLTGDGTLIISGTGAMRNYDYSSHYHAPWYDYSSQVKSVVLEDSITTIGDYAFSDCTNLNSVSIPNSITTIGFYAFDSCTGLTSVVIPDGVTFIDDKAFCSCSRLSSVTIPESVTTIGNDVFNWCSNLSRIAFVGNAPKFGSYCFYNVATTVYYPANNETWAEAICHSYGGDIAWVPV